MNKEADSTDENETPAEFRKRLRAAKRNPETKAIATIALNAFSQWAEVRQQLELQPLANELGCDLATLSLEVESSLNTADTSPVTPSLDANPKEQKPVKKGYELQKPVNYGTTKYPSTLATTVSAKQIGMAKRSILSKNPTSCIATRRKPNTLLEKLVPNNFTYKPWRDTCDNHKQMLAVAPLLDAAADQGYECKAFTLVLNERLSKRLDNGDPKALEQIRDQLAKKILATLGPDAMYLYGIEKAPAALSSSTGRRRWHLHGLITGPVGFSATGKTKLRLALKHLKGEAASDLMFTTPGEATGQEGHFASLRWAVYCTKNNLSVLEDETLRPAYDIPAGKATYICRALLKATKAHYETKILPYAIKPKGTINNP